MKTAEIVERLGRFGEWYTDLEDERFLRIDVGYISFAVARPELEADVDFLYWIKIEAPDDIYTRGTSLEEAEQACYDEEDYIRRHLDPKPESVRHNADDTGLFGLSDSDFLNAAQHLDGAKQCPADNG